MFADVRSGTAVRHPTLLHAYGVHDERRETSHGRGRGFESRIAHRVMSRDIEDSPNPHWGSGLFFLRVGPLGAPVGW
jgi:hypothetical protein